MCIIGFTPRSGKASVFVVPTAMPMHSGKAFEGNRKKNSFSNQHAGRPWVQSFSMLKVLNGNKFNGCVTRLPEKRIRPFFRIPNSLIWKTSLSGGSRVSQACTIIPDSNFTRFHIYSSGKYLSPFCLISTVISWSKMEQCWPGIPSHDKNVSILLLGFMNMK